MEKTLSARIFLSGSTVMAKCLAQTIERYSQRIREGTDRIPGGLTLA